MIFERKEGNETSLIGAIGALASSAYLLLSPNISLADGTNTNNAPVLSIEKKLSGTNITYKVTATGTIPGKNYTWLSVNNWPPRPKNEANEGWYLEERGTFTAAGTNATFIEPAAPGKRYYILRQNNPQQPE